MKAKKGKNYWYLSVLSIVLFLLIWWFCCDVLKLTEAPGGGFAVSLIAK